MLSQICCWIYDTQTIYIRNQPPVAISSKTRGSCENCISGLQSTAKPRTVCKTIFDSHMASQTKTQKKLSNMSYWIFLPISKRLYFLSAVNFQTRSSFKNSTFAPCLIAYQHNTIHIKHATAAIFISATSDCEKHDSLFLSSMENL